MKKRFLAVLALLMVFPSFVSAQISGNNDEVIENASALLTRHQQRMDILEVGLKEVRGILENDLREVKMKVEQMRSSSSEAGTSQIADLNALRDQMEKLSDVLAMTNRRMERTLEITSDTEFRLLRLEKRMQTLLALGGSDAAKVLVQQDTMGAGEAIDVQITRDTTTGISSWSVDENALDGALASGINNGGVSGDSAGVNAEANAKETDLTIGANLAGSSIDGSTAVSSSEIITDVTPVQPEILPAVSPEEQYRFALGRALQNDLETAELAFSEFRNFNKGHNREADSIFWLGRVQFMRGEYEKAAMTFSEFNTSYSGDARLVDTTMWIAESVSHFAPPEQACEIYAQLPQQIETPPEIFLTQLKKLSNAASCKN
jgi:TolA-binding protein